MNSVLAGQVDEALATVAVPIESGRAVRATVDVVPVETGWRYQAYWNRDPARREHFGPIFEYPRECMAFVDQVNRRAGPAIGDPVVVSGTKYRVRMAWVTDDRLDCRTSFGNQWVTVRAADLEWDDVAGVWRERPR